MGSTILGAHSEVYCLGIFSSSIKRSINRGRPRWSFYLVQKTKIRGISCCVREDKEEPKQTIIVGGAYSSLRHGPARLVNFTQDDSENYSQGGTKNDPQYSNIIGSQAERPSNSRRHSEENPIYKFFYPSKELLPDNKEMSLFDHLEELRHRVFVSVLAIGAAMLGCFMFSKELIILLEAPVSSQGVRFLQLSPGEFFFTTLKVSGYCGLFLGSPVLLYETIAFMLPGLTKDERRFLGPIVLGSSVLFYAGIFFSYTVLTPAALGFFVNYAEGAVESIWSIDQYFEFVLVLMFSTGLSFQVPVIQMLLGQLGLVSASQMLSIWRYVVVGALVVAAVLTPSTDPLTQLLLAGPLLGLYFGGAGMVKLTGH